MVSSTIVRSLCVAALLLGTVSALDAECNGRGLLYKEECELGLPCVCSCFGCFAGPNCETEQDPDVCQIDTGVADSTLFTEFFHGRDDLSLRLSSTYHSGYLKHPRVFTPGQDQPRTDTVSRLLNTTIRELHAKMGFDTSDYTLVLGAGGVQLLDASLYALTQGNNKKFRMGVFAEPPYYPHFRMESDTNPLTHWEGAEDSSDLNPNTTIEIVTNPNNPDGRHVYSTLGGPAIHDYVYQWPHYAAADGLSPMGNESLIVYSFSKLTGFAASRIGWAFVRDPAVAGVMSEFIWLSSTAPAVEAQLRAVRILRSIVDGIGQSPDKDFFQWARSTLDTRWNTLTTAFEKQDRFRVVGRSGVLYLWLQCQHPADQGDCAAVLAKAGVLADTGANYGADHSYVRVCIGQYEATFNVLLARIQSLFHNTDDTLRIGTKETEATEYDLDKATRKKPQPEYTARDPEDMAHVLNGHLLKMADSDFSSRIVAPCESLSLSDIHQAQAVMHAARSAELQSIYVASQPADPRATAVDGDNGLDKDTPAMIHRFAYESSVAAAGDCHAKLVRAGACHRAAMLYAHHLTKHARASLPDSTLVPLLPVDQLASCRASTSESGDHLLRAASEVHANATACIRCHTAAAAPARTKPLPPQPVVPDWPRGWTAPFGLTTKDWTNATSRVSYTAELPAMHISHSKCPSHFFPYMPDAAGGHQCDLHFLKTGLHIVWGFPQQCCALVVSNMSTNLGQHELGGFDFIGNTTARNYVGNAVPVEDWTSDASLGAPGGFHIYVDPTNGHDVHYRNGGPYYLEWAVDDWNLTPPPIETFLLPKGLDCSRVCHEDMSRAVHESHAPLIRRAGIHVEPQE